MNDELLTKINEYIFMQRLINMEDIKNIINLLYSFYRDTIYEGIKISNKSPYIMSYSIVSSKIYICADDLESKIRTVYKDRKFYQTISFNNYYNITIILFLVHEFTHSRQHYQMENKSLIGLLYSKCFDYIKKSNANNLMIYQAIYLKYHEYFPNEINANYKSYLFILKCLQEISIELFEFYESLFLNIVKNQYEFTDYDWFHENILKDTKLLEDIKNTLTEDEQILNGVLRIKPDDINMKKLILNNY